MAIEIGASIGHYKIVSKIGSGGMGEVYLAGDTKLERRVAIKFLHDELSNDSDKLNRFIQEARAASALNHPNILTVYEIGEADGLNYIATELIDGKTLRAHLASKHEMALSSILKIGVQVAEALSAAHAAGIIHRDIKPENIMIRGDGYAKVLDFGLAKLSEPAASVGRPTGSEVATRAQVNTMPGMVMGTAAYMSPEQARGNPTDARTDIWSLGIVLYEMLAGHVPFSGETVNHTIVAILEREPLLLEGVPQELQRIVRKALTKDLEMRYQSARDLLIDLKNLRRDLDIQGELERSVVPHRATTSQISGESETHFYTGSGERTVSGQTGVTQNVTSSSSLEYAVNQAKSHKAVTAVIGMVLIVALGLIGYFGLTRSASGQINSIAVLPFENRSNDPNADYLSDGLAESLIYRLSQLPNLKVSPTGSVMRYKGKGGSIAEIASELGVQAVLTGRLVQRGESLSISIELIDTANNKVLWGEQYEKKMSELLATQREIATAITEKLQLKLSGNETAGITKKYTDSNEAYQLYLKGRFQWNKRTVDGLKAAEAFYKQAIDADPSFALAYSALAETYVLFPNYSVASSRESAPKAKAAAMKAIEIDPTLAEPHAALGLYHGNYTWDIPANVRELRRAIELNPKYATAHHWLGVTLPIVGKCDEAIAAGKHAEELDPLSAIIASDLGFDLIQCRRYDEAITQLEKALKLDPNFYYAHFNIGLAKVLKGNAKDGVLSLRRSAELNEDPYAKALFAFGLAKAGERAEATKLGEELRAESKRIFIDPYFLAIVHVGLGNNDAAIAALETSLAERGAYTPMIAIDPVMDDLRSDPRYPALVKKIQTSILE